MLSLHIEVDRAPDGTWVGLAPWTPAPLTANTWEELYEKIARARWTR